LISPASERSPDAHAIHAGVSAAQTIVEGRQPPDLTIEALIKRVELPPDRFFISASTVDEHRRKRVAPSNHRMEKTGSSAPETDRYSIISLTAPPIKSPELRPFLAVR